MGFSVSGFAAAALTGMMLSGPVHADNAVARLESGLAAAPSATQFLTGRCAALKLASPPVIKAMREREERPASAQVRGLLKVAADTRLGYRRVVLACGTHALSEADNWYVPERLTPAMNRQLGSSDTPFGAAVKPLNFHRIILKAESLDGAVTVLRITAVLETADGRPFSLVVENYTRELVGGAANH
jgi:hypothetical protein